MKDHLKKLATPKGYAEYISARAVEMSEKKPRGFDIKAVADTAEIYIYDVIDPLWGVNASDLVKEIDGIDTDHITVRINTPGGYVSDGIAIYNALIRHKAEITTVIDAEAASMGSIIALAGDRVKMADNAMFMIHNPWSIAIGNADDFRAQADVLDKLRAMMVDIYTNKTGKSEEEIQNWMDQTTYFNAQESLDAGFVDEVISMSRTKQASKSKAETPANTEFNSAKAQAQARLRLLDIA